jgi:hypothetical protein
MAINFPISPLVGDLYTYNGFIWQYTSGGYWKTVSEQDSIYSATTVGGGTPVISGITGGNLYLKSFSGDGITISDSNGVLTFSASTGGGSFTGGTVTGATSFTGGLTANTIFATTYQNLPVSGVTSGTGISASTNNGVATITNTDLGSSQNIFKTIRIDNNSQFSAQSNTASLNFSGINITITSAATNTLVFSAGTGSGGVTSVTATSGLSGNSTTGAITIINTGVTGVTAGSGISVNQSTGNVTISASAGFGTVYTTGNNLNFI